MEISSSLFNAPAEPVISRGADWIGQMVAGSAATTLCVIAIAILGIMLMTGRVAFRDSLRVVIGCFVLLGAPAIAIGLLGAVEGAGSPMTPPADVASSLPQQPQTKLPPANYDPYAGASLRIE